MAHCLVLNRLQPDVFEDVRAGTLLVPGGYPQKWANDNGMPFPPPAEAASGGRPAPEVELASLSLDSAEGEVDVRPARGSAPRSERKASSRHSSDSERTIADDIEHGLPPHLPAALTLVWSRVCLEWNA